MQRPSAKADSSNPQNFEREEMSRQIQMLSQHLESSKRMQDSLMDTMKAKEQQSSPEKNSELLTMNSNLTQQILEMQKKHSSQDDEMKSLKKYKKIVNNCMALQCKFCSQHVLKEHFQDHSKSCEIEQDKARVSVLQAPSPTLVSGRRTSFVGSRLQKKKMLI